MTDLFKIYQIGVEDVLKIGHSTNAAHQHDFEELIIGMEGQMTHFIDFKTQHIQAPFASFVSRGKVHRVVPELHNGRCQFWVLRFKSEFIAETTFQLYGIYHEYADVAFEDNSCFARLVKLCEIIDEEMQQKEPDLAVVQHLLSSLFIMVNAQRKALAPNTSTQLHNQNTTFRNFLMILEENYRRPEGVNFYAEKLFMTVRNLNIICHNILQQSVSEIIETRKLMEAKNMLLTSDKAVTDIAFELGYSDRAHFSAVFKKKSGQTPTQFREEIQHHFRNIHL